MVRTHFGPAQHDDCPMCGRRRLEPDDWDRAMAVSVRPHYDPCDFPDHACSCGAAEDRPNIAAALDAAEQRGAERVAQRMRELAERWEADAKRNDDAEPISDDGLTRMILAARFLRMNASDLRAALADVAPPTAGREGL